MLNAYFQSGAVPACVTSALVIPIHKESKDLNTANCTPIAVGEPLHRLYISILNERILDRSEQHEVCSPVQAGFRPYLSTVDHIFTLRYFIDHAQL